MSLQSALEKLAAEHLERMAAAGWQAYAETLNKNGHGETFGCEVDGVYCDVGDSVRWESQIGGPIILTVYAAARDQRADRSLVLKDISN